MTAVRADYYHTSTRVEDKSIDTRARILRAAETLLRRHGPAKTTVVDVARTLGMSHANVYRHFASKTALIDALLAAWLQPMCEPLRTIAERDDAAARRLEEWLLAFISVKRRRVLDDPELFAAYHDATEESRDVVVTHLDTVRTQLLSIIDDGVARGEFKVSDSPAAARATLNSVVKFYHPHLVRESAAAPYERDARYLVRLTVAGLRTGEA